MLKPNNMKQHLTQEQVNRLYDGLQEYVSNDPICPNCTHTNYNTSDHEGYTSYTCQDCGYDYYAVNGETRLI